MHVLPPHTIQCRPVIRTRNKDKLCPSTYHERYSSHLYVQALYPHVPILHLHALHTPRRLMYFLPTQFNDVLSSIRATRTNFVLTPIMSAIPPPPRPIHALHPHVPVLHLHALHTPRRLMYFLPTQFNVVLSSIRATRTNFVLAPIMSAIPPTSTSRLYTL